MHLSNLIRKNGQFCDGGRLAEFQREREKEREKREKEREKKNKRERESTNKKKIKESPTAPKAHVLIFLNVPTC